MSLNGRNVAFFHITTHCIGKNQRQTLYIGVDNECRHHIKDAVYNEKAGIIYKTPLRVSSLFAILQ